MSFESESFMKALSVEIEALFSPNSLPADRMQKLAAFGTALAETSQFINLTRILDPRDMAVRHFLDSCQLLQVLKNVSGPVCDIGTGGGIPGIPLAIFRRDLNVVMIDGTAKKIRFIQQCIQDLELKNASALAERAEEHLRSHRYHALINRAAIKPPALLEILAFTGPATERIIFMEGASGKEKVKSLRGPARRAGYTFDFAFPYRLPGLDNERYLICYKRR
ncbi:MAG: 16S rRNA (guanine(527)-N(7))-methyltransferase RsmG [Planctomycetota bacterium]